MSPKWEVNRPHNEEDEGTEQSAEKWPTGGQSAKGRKAAQEVSFSRQNLRSADYFTVQFLKNPFRAERGLGPPGEGGWMRQRRDNECEGGRKEGVSSS